MDFTEIVHRQPLPAAWAEGEKIPWDEPGFSRRMLREHLSQEHDWASRKSATIDKHADWIRAQLPPDLPPRLLDLGCGPGLYCSRLARQGWECLGIDFSPASIEYARQEAGKDHLTCTYRQEDVRRAEFGTGYGLVMFVYGELNVFRPKEAADILAKARRALLPGGTLLLEVHTYEAVCEIGSAAPHWYSAESGLFSEEPHLLLQESFWDPDCSTTTQRYYVIDAGSGRVTRYASSMQAYTRQAYGRLLQEAGFSTVKEFPSLTGEPDPGQAALFVLWAQ